MMHCIFLQSSWKLYALQLAEMSVINGKNSSYINDSQACIVVVILIMKKM